MISLPDAASVQSKLANIIHVSLPPRAFVLHILHRTTRWQDAVCAKIYVTFSPLFLFLSFLLKGGLSVCSVGYCSRAVQGPCPRGAGLDMFHTHIPCCWWETDVSLWPIFAQLTVHFHRRTMSIYLSIRSLPDDKHCYIRTQNKGFAKYRNSLRASPLRLCWDFFFPLL